MNDETISALGGFSKELLGDARFKALVQLFGQQMATDMLATMPHETKKREGLHAAYSGFTEFTDLLTTFAEAYDKLYNEAHGEATADNGFED